MNRVQACFIPLCLPCIFLLNPLAASAGSIVIGQVNPPGRAGDISGITFDRGPNPLVLDSFGTTIWRIDINNARVLSTFPLTSTDLNTRSLDFDATTGQYFTSQQAQPGGDYLSTINPTSGIIKDIAGMRSGTSTFNFLDMAVDPVTDVLWLVNDCSDIACTSIQGGSLWTVNKTTGWATPVETFGTKLGQLTSLAISPQGQFFVASSSSIYEISPTTGQSAFITNTGLAPFGLFSDMAFDPITNSLYGVEDRRGSTPGTWYLDEITGLPSPVPEPGTATFVFAGLALIVCAILRRNARTRQTNSSGVHFSSD